MAEVRPFKGLSYDTGKVGGDYASVVAPPYDVISDKMRDELYEKNAYNIIRLILGKSIEGDNDKHNKYTRAGQLVAEWQDQNILLKDKSESFYVYTQEYEYDGKVYNRIGFFGLMKIEDPGERSVIPHEYTLAKPKEDRMNLIKQVKGNLSPIFVLFEDNGAAVSDIIKKEISSSKPLIDIEVNGETHKIWRVSDPEAIKNISSQMKGKKVYIADGHHRYEVAMVYRNMQREKPDYDGSADYVLMYFTDMTGNAADNSLTVVATHRAIKEIQVKEDEIAGKLGKYFDVEECGDIGELLKRLKEATAKDHFFGYFGGNRYLIIKLKNEGLFQELISDKKSLEWKCLDVSILHSGIFKNLLGLKEEEGNITYVKDPVEAEALVKEGSHAAAFFLNPTRVEQIKAVAEKGDMMPQKSTYFYPKLLSGLVINKFA